MYRKNQYTSGKKKSVPAGWEVLGADCCGSACPLRRTPATDINLIVDSYLDQLSTTAWYAGELFSERPVTIISATGVQKNLSITTTILRDTKGDSFNLF